MSTTRENKLGRLRRISKRKAAGLMVTTLWIAVSLLMHQVAVTTVFAEGSGEVPDFIDSLETWGLSNMTFEISDSVINFTYWNQPYIFDIHKASITITTSEFSDGATETAIFLDIEGVTVDIPELKMTVNKLLLQIAFRIENGKSVFQVVGTTYVPVYRLIQTAIEKVPEYF